MPPVEHVIIAAAGRGKRLGRGMPKCLVPVNGIPIINYLLYLVRDIPSVRLVVGYCEDDVVKHVRSIKRDVIFVRNPNFRHTTTLQSFFLAGRGLHSPVLCVDGDMIIEENSFTAFLAQCDEKPLVGVASEISEDPVYAYTEGQGESLSVTGFGRDRPATYEWANMALIPPQWLAFEQTHFFEKLAHHLPLSAVPIRRVEIDTPPDLVAANTLLQRNTAYCPHVDAQQV